MKTRKMKCAALLAGSGMAFGFGGSCVPDNFWMDTWDGVLTTVVDTAAEVYVVDTLTDFIVPAEE